MRGKLRLYRVALPLNGQLVEGVPEAPSELVDQVEYFYDGR